MLVLTLAGGALRFATLDAQSYWLDELVTVSLLDRSLGDVLAEIPETEATPYAYYVVAWGWSSVFGLGEVGLRSLSALAGTATIPVAYGAGTVLVSRRTGLVAAALVAANPFLVWYAQEARSYALLALLAAASVLAFAHALRGSARWLGAWAVVSSLAIATHYYALFLVAAEIAWLLLRVRPRRRAIVASTAPVLTLVAHAPLLLEQRENGEAVAGASLAARIAGIPKNLVVGYSFPAEAIGSALAAVLLVVGIVLVARLGARERRPAVLSGSLVAAVVAVPVVLAVGGADYLVARNAIVAVVPAAVFVAAGYASSRLGLVAAGVLCTLLAALALAPAMDAPYGRTDWRGAASRLDEAPVPRAIVVTPYMSRTLWRPYLPGLDEPRSDRVLVEEIAVVGLATEGGYSAGAIAPPTVAEPRALEGFRVVAIERTPTFAFVRYRAARPTPVTVPALTALALAPEQPGVLIQGGCCRR